MAGTHCLRHQPLDHHPGTGREHGGKRRGPGNNCACQGGGTGGICATAIVLYQPATIIRSKKARTEAATPTKNSKETRGAACIPGSAAPAIWLVWLLVSSRLSSS